MGNGSKYLKTWQQREAGMSSVVLAYLGPVLHLYCKLTKVCIAVLHFPAVFQS